MDAFSREALVNVLCARPLGRDSARRLGLRGEMLFVQPAAIFRMFSRLDLRRPCEIVLAMPLAKIKCSVAKRI